MSRPSTSRFARRACAAGVAATALTLIVAAAPAPAVQATAEKPGPGLSGWWYDALVVEEAHRETTGEGATVIMGDGGIDTTVPELRGADLTLHENCNGGQTTSVTKPLAQHGTTMASLIVGSGRGNGPGGKGVAGIAPGARLMYHSLDSYYFSNGFDCEDEILPYIEESVRRAGNGPIVSWSMGGMASGYKEMQREVERAGGVWVAAAGDRFDPSTRGMIDSPAGLAGFVAVLALDEDAQPADLNPTRYVTDGVKLGYPTISAPGVDIPSVAWQDGGWRSGVPETGTSHATALVAGALALVKSKYPEATGNQLIQHLIHFDTDPEEFTWSDERGFGIVSLRNMLANDPTGWPDVNPMRMKDLDHPTGIRQPGQVLAKFPMSVYDPERGRDTAEADATGASADEDAGAEETDAQAAETSATDAEGGVPVPVWIAAGVAVLVLLGSAVVLARRTRTTG
jgi:subtilisin family serine protease